MATQTKIRYHALDWLRVIAFSLLIFYHSAMLFVSWDWHIKNNEISQSLEWPMLFLSQWRMSLIFLISGAGVYFALGYRGAGIFAADRFRRILLPLVAGMILVVPPQVYLERLDQGFSASYFSFFPSIFEFEPYPQGNFSWHHLWYLAYIFCYSLLLLPLLLYLRKKQNTFKAVQRWMILVLPIAWLSIGESLLRPLFPATNALWGDWANHFLYIHLFTIGFIIFSSPFLQEKIRTLRGYSLSIGLVLLGILYSQYWLPPAAWSSSEGTAYLVLKTANRWCWVMAILGFAIQYLNIKSPHLKTANEMVYPFYILHQTIIIILGYSLRDFSWPIGAKFALIVAATFVICFILTRYIIMKSNLLRVLFGLKPIGQSQQKSPKQDSKAGQIPA